MTTENESKGEGESGLSANLDDILWRLRDIREMLLHTSFGGQQTYGCDEWSTPVVNLNSAIKRVEAIKAANVACTNINQPATP